jgi:Bacterial dnaA protein helix-turn-helix
MTLSPTHPTEGKTLATFDSKSFIPLLAVQQRPHSRIYAMPVREYDSAAEATAAGVAARGRLRAAPPRQLTGPATTMAIQPKPLEPLPIEAKDAPLNMLGPCSWRFLVALAALRHGCEPATLISPVRTKMVVRARHEAFYLITLHTAYSIARIGRLFGRDHTTVLGALRKFPRIVRPRLSLIAVAQPLTNAAPERERAIARGYAAGTSCADIAKQIGLSASLVKVHAHRRGLRHPGRPYFSRKSKHDWEAAGL